MPRDEGNRRHRPYAAGRRAVTRSDAACPRELRRVDGEMHHITGFVTGFALAAACIRCCSGMATIERLATAQRGTHHVEQ